jgi:hypothetical protein
VPPLFVALKETSNNRCRRGVSLEPCEERGGSALEELEWMSGVAAVMRRELRATRQAMWWQGGTMNEPLR